MFATALISDQAHPSIPAEDRIFEPFIGSWQLVVTWFLPDGTVARQENAEWHFARVLEGRAIQDVWITPPRSERQDASRLYEYGTSLRFYEPATRIWRSSWIGPMHGMVRTFTARLQEGRVVLDTGENSEPRLRWSFFDVAPASFSWSNEILDGSRWRIQQSFSAKRMT